RSLRAALEINRGVVRHRADCSLPLPRQVPLIAGARPASWATSRAPTRRDVSNSSSVSSRASVIAAGEASINPALLVVRLPLLQFLGRLALVAAQFRDQQDH